VFQLLWPKLSFVLPFILLKFIQKSLFNFVFVTTLSHHVTPVPSFVSGGLIPVPGAAVTFILCCYAALYTVGSGPATVGGAA
jgi:hypothetical protein